jgi:hypothetical protein
MKKKNNINKNIRKKERISKLSNLLNWLHELFVIVMIFGCFINDNYIRVHLYAFPILIIHWLTNDGYCFVTEVTAKMSEESDKLYGDKEESSRLFMKRFYLKYGLDLSGYWLNVSTITFFFIAWIISSYRYYCKFEKFPFLEFFV